MSRERLRIRNTPLDNLVSNLRGEVGEIISTWTILRHFMTETRRLSSDDIRADFQNQTLTIVGVLSHKLRDEIIARLSELAQPKVGRLNFHFVSTKLGKFEDDVRNFNDFIEANRFREKRNYDISHRELPEQWEGQKFIRIPYRKLLYGIVFAIILMKKIDRFVIGPAAPYLWREVRKKRYKLTMPPRLNYLLLPYCRHLLSEQDHTNIRNKEMEEQNNLI